MKIELGKKYVTRDGEVVGPLTMCPAGHRHRLDVWYDPNTTTSWLEDGAFDRAQGECSNDLVSEYVDSVALACVSDGDAYDLAIMDALAEVRRAKTLWPDNFHNAHEGYAVMLEEVYEFWDQVKIKQSARSPARMRTEAIQIAAMALRVAVECCDEDSCRR